MSEHESVIGMAVDPNLVQRTRTGRGMVMTEEGESQGTALLIEIDYLSTADDEMHTLTALMDRDDVEQLIAQLIATKARIEGVTGTTTFEIVMDLGDGDGPLSIEFRDEDDDG